MLLTVPATVDSTIVAATPATLSWQGVDSDGEPADPGTVTVTITRADGTTVAADAATGGTGTAARTYALTVSQTAALDVLHAVWAAGGVTVGTTRHDVVGSASLTLNEFQRLSRQDGETPAGTFLAARRGVDAFMLKNLGRSVVPRFDVERVYYSGAGEVPLAYPHLRRVRWARWYDSDNQATEIEDVADIRADPAGVARHDAWLCGWLEVGYEHGWDRASEDAKRVWARLTRAYLGDTRSTIDDRATTYQAADGALVTLGVEGRPGWWTSIPMVNEFILENRWTPAHTGFG